MYIVHLEEVREYSQTMAQSLKTKNSMKSVKHWVLREYIHQCTHLKQMANWKVTTSFSKLVWQNISEVLR